MLLAPPLSRDPASTQNNVAQRGQPAHIFERDTVADAVRAMGRMAVRSHLHVADSVHLHIADSVGAARSNGPSTARPPGPRPEPAGESPFERHDRMIVREFLDVNHACL